MAILDNQYGLSDHSGTTQLPNDVLANILRQQAPPVPRETTGQNLTGGRPPEAQPGPDGPQPASSIGDLKMAGPTPSVNAAWQKTDWQKAGHDSYYNGAIPQTHIMYTLGSIADTALPLAAAAGAHGIIHNRFGDSELYATGRTQGLVDTLQNESRSLQRVVTRAHQTEFDDVVSQMRRIAGRVGGNPSSDSNWLSLDRASMTQSERAIADRWQNLRFPQIDTASIDRARAATSDPELQRLLTERETAFTAARGEYQTAFSGARGFANAMSRNSLGALAIGEVANIAMDHTIFNDTPHSLRTILSDVVAPAIVFTNFSLPVKAGVIAGTHLINRYLDSQNPDTGKF